MASYLLTKQAQEDIRTIFEYGIAQFGLEQAVSYIDKLEETLELIASTPKIARIRNELNHQTRVFPFNSHIILYKELKGTALIISIRSTRENWLT